jgi:hypothetical protein
MANNYFDATGVLILDRVTPVISALFGGFHLDGTYPGNGAAYIARLSESNDPQWDDVFEGLVNLAEALGKSLPAGDEFTIEDCLHALANHFQAEEDEALEYLIEHHSFEDSADLAALFLIATCFNDGHGLKAIKFEAAWYCSKPRLYEFGGQGTYISQEIVLYSGSSRAVDFGEELHAALLRGNLDEAADKLAADIGNVLSGITDDTTRSTLREKLARKLLNDGDVARGESASDCL